MPHCLYTPARCQGGQAPKTLQSGALKALRLVVCWLRDEDAAFFITAGMWRETERDAKDGGSVGPSRQRHQERTNGTLERVTTVSRRRESRRDVWTPLRKTLCYQHDMRRIKMFYMKKKDGTMYWHAFNGHLHVCWHRNTRRDADFTHPLNLTTITWL